MQIERNFTPQWRLLTLEHAIVSCTDRTVRSFGAELEVHSRA